VKIVETTAGSVTSTKQFVWGSDKYRQYQSCEERDGSGVLTKKFFDGGQQNTTTKYFYTKDHLGSVREMTDNAGVIQAQYAFDPYGLLSKVQGAQDSDFQYAGYYAHSRSGLNLTRTRAYSGSLAKWLTRDQIGDSSIRLALSLGSEPTNSYVLPMPGISETLAGSNLYRYVRNNPITWTDLDGTVEDGEPNSPERQLACLAKCGAQAAEQFVVCTVIFAFNQPLGLACYVLIPLVLPLCYWQCVNERPLLPPPDEKGFCKRRPRGK